LLPPHPFYSLLSLLYSDFRPLFRLFGLVGLVLFFGIRDGYIVFILKGKKLEIGFFGNCAIHGVLCIFGVFEYLSFGGAWASWYAAAACLVSRDPDHIIYTACLPGMLHYIQYWLLTIHMS
jgi:hypothetical protein